VRDQNLIQRILQGKRRGLIFKAFTAQQQLSPAELVVYD